VASKLSLFLAELKRRKVTRVAVVYVLVGLGAIEAVDIIGSRLLFPEWAIQFVIVLVLVGFPIAIVLAWALEVTPQGVQRTPDLTPDQLASQAPEKWSASSWVFAGAGLVVVLGAGYFVFFRDQGPDLLENRVAVIPFENRTGDVALDALGSMAADKITEGISGSELYGDFVEVVPSELVRSVSSSQQEHASASLVNDPVRALAEATGAGTIVSGWYYLEGESLLLRAEITGVVQGQVLVSVQERGPVGRVTDALEDLSERVMGGFLTHVLVVDEDRLFQDPPKHSALLAWNVGVESYEDREWREAIVHFDRAFGLDTTFVAARLRTALSYLNDGEPAAADSVMNLLEPHRAGLSRIGRHNYDWNRFRVRGDLLALIDVWRGWRVEHPDDPSAGYGVGYNAKAVNRPREAIDVLSPTTTDSPGFWHPLWDHLAASHHMLGEHEQELRVAQQGFEAFPNEMSTLQDQVEALGAVGRADEINLLLDEALTYSEGSPGEVMRVAAEELRAHGYSQEASQVLSRALDWYNNRPPSEARSESVRYGVARVHYQAERWGEAERLLEALAAENPDSVSFLGYLGALAARQGDREKAVRISEKLAETDVRYLLGLNTYWRASIQALLGERERAVNLLREAHAQGREFGITWHRDINLEPLRSFPPFEELMRPKG